MTSAVQLVTDPCIEGGNRDMQEFFSSLSQQNLVATNNIPDPADGTRSFIAGIILNPIVQTGAVTLRNIMGKRSTAAGFPGWQIWTSLGSLLRPRFIIDWGGTDNNLEGLDVQRLIPGEPDFILVNADFDSLRMKLITPRGETSQAFTDQGTFANVVTSLQMGIWNVAGWHGLQHNWALAFTFQYSDSLDAQLDAANMTRFLKFSNGVL
jgi:hypothetical protein